MAEVFQRDELENAFLLRLMSQWEQRRQSLKDMLGDTPSLRNVTFDFWQTWQNDNEEELLFFLAFVFLRAAMQHGEALGITEDVARIEAERFARARAMTSSQSITRTSQRILDTANRLWEQGKKLDSVDERLEMVFGNDRLERVVVTETSEAASYGAEWAVGVTGNLSGEDTWFTARDERVCGYCGPLHGKPRRLWQRIYEQVILPAHPEFAVYGPPQRTPAHVVCRCFVNYAVGVGNVNPLVV